MRKRLQNASVRLGVRYEFQGGQLTRNLALCDALRPIAERYGTTVSSVAIAWVLAWPGVSGAIVGARTPAQVDGWVAAASLELTPLDLDETDGVIERTGAGAGPVHPAAPRAIARRSAVSRTGHMVVNGVITSDGKSLPARCDSSSSTTSWFRSPQPAADV